MAEVYSFNKQATPKSVRADDLAKADADLKAAKSQLHNSKRLVGQFTGRRSYLRFRIRLGKSGLPDWVLALIAGSFVAAVLSIVAIVVGWNIGAVLTIVALSYIMAGGGVFFQFRNMSVEDEESKLTQIEMALAAARQKVADCRVVVNDSHEVHNRIQAILESESHQREKEADRLLGVEFGRLYPDEFERFVAEIFAHLGYQVLVSGKTGDQGVDVVAIKGPVRLAIQAKRHQNSVGNTAIQEVYAGMAHRQCNRCAVVTNSDFTLAAKALAKSTNCLLVGGDEIPALIHNQIAL